MYIFGGIRHFESAVLVSNRQFSTFVIRRVVFNGSSKAKVTSNGTVEFVNAEMAVALGLLVDRSSNDQKICPFYTPHKIEYGQHGHLSLCAAGLVLVTGCVKRIRNPKQESIFSDAQILLERVVPCPSLVREPEFATAAKTKIPFQA